MTTASARPTQRTTPSRMTPDGHSPNDATTERVRSETLVSFSLVSVPAPSAIGQRYPATWPAHDLAEQLRDLLDARLPGEALSHVLRELDGGQAAVAKLPVEGLESRAEARDVVGRDDDPRAGLADELRRGAVRWHRGQD